MTRLTAWLMSLIPLVLLGCTPAVVVEGTLPVAPARLVVVHVGGPGLETPDEAARLAEQFQRALQAEKLATVVLVASAKEMVRFPEVVRWVRRRLERLGRATEVRLEVAVLEPAGRLPGNLIGFHQGMPWYEVDVQWRAPAAGGWTSARIRSEAPQPDRARLIDGLARTVARQLAGGIP